MDRTNLSYRHVHVHNVSSNKDEYSVVFDTEALDFAFLWRILSSCQACMNVLIEVRDSPRDVQ